MKSLTTKITFGIILGLVIGVIGCSGGGGGGSPTPNPQPNPPPGQTTAPFTLNSSVPSSGATGVTVDTPITLTFSQNVNLLSEHNNSVKIWDPSNPGLDNIILTSDADKTHPISIHADFTTSSQKVLAITADYDLRITKSYTLLIRHTLEDSDGAQLASDTSIHFSVGSKYGTNPETVELSLTDDSSNCQGGKSTIGQFKVGWGLTEGVPTGGSTTDPCNPPNFSFDTVNDKPLDIETTLPAGVTLPSVLTGPTQFITHLPLDENGFQPQDTYFFAVKSCDTSGECSSYSGQVSFVIP